MKASVDTMTYIHKDRKLFGFILIASTALTASTAFADTTLDTFGFVARGSIAQNGTSMGGFSQSNLYTSFQGETYQASGTSFLSGPTSVLAPASQQGLTDPDGKTVSPVTYILTVPSIDADGKAGTSTYTFDHLGKVLVSPQSNKYSFELYGTSDSGEAAKLTVSGTETTNSLTGPGANSLSFALRTDSVTVTGKATGLTMESVAQIGEGFTLNYNFSDGGTGFAGSLTLPGVLTDSSVPGSVIIKNSSDPGNGNGTIVFVKDQKYTGGTTINGGATLQLGNGGTSGSVLGDIVNNGQLVVDRSDTLTYAGTISGTGSLTKTGTGTLILTGDSTYTGGTTISEGTLQIGDGGTTGSIVGDVVNNATLVFDRAGTYDFPGTITGSGAVIIVGGSTVNFTGASGYDGEITVSDSDFVLSSGAVSGSAYTIESGGRIGGSGTIGGLTVASGGTAAPGYSPGTLTVAGNVTFLAGSTYDVDVTAAGAHDLITATGTASILGGTVAVNASPGSYNPMTRVTILQANGGVTGTFSDVTSNLAFLTPQLSYDANDVYLTLFRNDISFASQAETANQRALAGAADPLGWSNPVYYALANLATGAAPAAFDSLSGEAYASASGVMLQQSSYLRDAVNARLAQALTPESAASGPATAALSPELAPTLWMQGFGAWANASGNGNAASTASTIGGLFGGLDVALDDTWRAGLVAGYSRTTFDVDGRSSSGTSDNYDIGAYAGARYGDLNLKTGISYTWHDADMRRAVAFDGYSGVNSAGYDAATTQVFGEAGYTVHMDDMTLEPFAGLAYVHLATRDLTETGSTSALSVSTQDMDTLFSSIGVRLGSQVTLASGVTISPSLSLAWQHAFDDVTPVSTARFASGSQDFAVAGVPLARNSGLIRAGLDYHLGPNAVLSANYSGRFAGGAHDNAVKVGLTVNF
ncbi:autotransporter domain-containing protein [Rhizobium straminoryzae]|uniref:Autotransporter domain-containing protein n=1 Tax=Rhizobium straminoryzae TaxID=1387186 RepID=A0A549T7E5_9HYPH|nr:autotransporter domain-containing protein [Rhizobium straminoryzae]